MQNTAEKNDRKFSVNKVGFVLHNHSAEGVFSNKGLSQAKQSLFYEVNAQLSAHTGISARIDLTQTKHQALIDTHTQSPKIGK